MPFRSGVFQVYNDCVNNLDSSIFYPCNITGVRAEFQRRVIELHNLQDSSTNTCIESST
jgi:hypothetical protein